MLSGSWGSPPRPLYEYRMDLAGVPISVTRSITRRCLNTNSVAICKGIEQVPQQTSTQQTEFGSNQGPSNAD